MNGIAMTPEQEKLHADLVKKYGLLIVKQARHLSGLSLCLKALALDDLAEDERKKSFARATMHLGQLLETVMSTEYSAKVTECAARLDSAIDLWMADEVEQREGFTSQETTEAGKIALGLYLDKKPPS